MVLLTLLRKLVDEVGEETTHEQELTVLDGSEEPNVGSSSGAFGRVGTRLGPYRVREFLRAGGMGEIYSAVDERLGRTVALKVLPGHLCADRNRRRRLMEEARLLSAISHPHICTLYDVGSSRGVDFLVMEYLEGRTLADRLAAGPVRLSEALRIGSQIASALDAAHRAGIVHRDLKPGNVMLTGRPEGPDPGVKVLDFGLARIMGRKEVDDEEGSRERTTDIDLSKVEGTCPYMAPEQLVNGEVDSRTDIWALGVVLYEMVCGRRPFEGIGPAALVTGIMRSSPKAPSEIGAGCGPEFSRVIERCLEKDRSRRWPSCADLARGLDDVAVSETADGGTNGALKNPWSLLKQIGPAAAFCGLLMTAPTASPAQSVSVDRLDRPQMEEFLSQGRIGKLQRLSTGVTVSSRAIVTWQGASHDAHVQTVDTYFGGGSRVSNRSDRYAYNVAAYRLDKLLDLDLVPVSVVRAVNAKPAAVTWWIDDVAMMELERRKLQLEPPRPRVKEWNDQMYRAFAFHELISNADFNQTNVLITSEWRLWLVDFTRAFRSYRKLDQPNRFLRIDRGLYDALARLDEQTLRREMKGLLSVSQIRSLLARRDLMLAFLEERAASRAVPSGS
jgi:serine/threonine protein kinase